MNHGRRAPTRLILPVLAVTIGILTGCPRLGALTVVTPTLPQITLQAGLSTEGPAPARGDEAAVPITFGVRWPAPGDHAIQAMPPDTRAVVFHLSKNEVPIQTVTVIRDPASQTTSKTVLLYPGDYVVRVRAYPTDLPTDASPVLASGAQSFAVLPGQSQQTVSITLTISPSPVPASPFPTVQPSASPEVSPTPATPTPTPTPTPSPTPGVLRNGYLWVRVSRMSMLPQSDLTAWAISGDIIATTSVTTDYSGSLAFIFDHTVTADLAYYIGVTRKNVTGKVSLPGREPFLPFRLDDTVEAPHVTGVVAGRSRGYSIDALLIINPDIDW